MTACTTCGTVPRPGAAFCGECGAAMPAAAPPADRPGFITLPPGVTPVTATNTGPAPSPAARAAAPPPPIVPPAATPIVPPAATPAATPVAPPVVAPVVPPEASAPRPATPAPLPVAAEAAEPVDVDATRMAAPRRAATWNLILPDGSAHLLSATAVVGRAPDAAAHGAETAVSVGADQKSVSKSHALIELVSGGLRVRDLGSVNGVVVVRTDGSEVEATADQWVDLTDGDELELGEVVIVVRRG